jgi:peptidyl-dipeptidase Dcp
MLRTLLAAAVVGAVTTASTLAIAAETAPPAERDNPLLAPWAGPYGGVPPLDRLRVEDFPPALQAGMALQRRDIAAITANPASPSFANTVLALERSGDLLRRARSMYFLWTASLNSPAMRQLEREVQPQLAAYNDELNQNAALFQRIEVVYQSAEMKRLTPEQQRLVWSYRTAFVKQGARLDPAAKHRVAEINQRLAALQTEFSQNLLADEQKEALVIADVADLAGLTPADVAALVQEAQRRGLKDRWVVANTRSAMEPFLSRSPRRALCEQAWRMWTYRGEMGEAHDNNRVVSEILALRAERSRLMGFATYAHWKLSDTMAREPQATLELMLKVWWPAVEQLRQQIAQMQAIADAEQDAAGASRFALQPWDLRYYAEKLRKAQYDFDAEQLTLYLQLDKVREAMFWAAGRLYGLRFEPVQGVPVFHPDVTVYRVLGPDGHHVGLWYFDPYARDSKSSGAWMQSYRPQQRMAGDVTPIVSNNANFRHGRPGEPVLVSWVDAVTMFHEFGHALHGLLSDVTYPRLAGPFSVSDFGEVPAMVNEYWLPTAPVLGRLVDAAGHPLPQALVDKLLRAQNFDIPFARTEFLASALLDMRLHLVPGGAVGDLRAFEKSALDELGMPSAIVARHRIPQFGHVFSDEGYAAGYYGYLWADVLARDVFGAFVEAGDPFDTATAKRYLKTMLSVGNTADPGEAFRRFRGRDPQADALLKAEGLAR